MRVSPDWQALTSLATQGLSLSCSRTASKLTKGDLAASSAIACLVGEFDDLDFEAVFFSDLPGLLKNLRMRAGSHAHLERLVLGQGQTGLRNNG